MRPLFKLLLVTILIQPSGLFAKAGTSYTSSKSSSSNIGSKANKAPATIQYSSTAIKPTNTIKPSTSVSAASKQTQTATTPTQNSSTTTTTTNTTHNIERDRGGDSGIGIGGVIVGTAVGTMVGNSLSNHNQPSTTIINNGQPQQPIQATQQSEYYQPQIIPTQVVQTQPKQQESSGFFTFMLWILGITTLVALAFYFYKRKKTSLANIQHSVPHFMSLFTNIQKLSTLNNPLDKEKLIPLCTDEIFLELTKITSENIEKNLHNIVDDISIISATIMNMTSDDTGHYCSVKFNFKMKDYVINDKNELIHGSKDQYVNDIEVWTFKTTNYRTWKLSAIELYVK